MIDKQQIEELVRQLIDDNDYFVVDVTVGSDDKITVYLDKFGSGISLDECEAFHRKLYPELEKLYDNFDLTVSSPGLTTEFKVWQQYYKNKGQEIEVLTVDGQQMRGTIIDADQDKVVLQVKKQQVTLPYDQIKKAKLVLKF